MLESMRSTSRDIWVHTNGNKFFKKRCKEITGKLINCLLPEIIFPSD
jgi:hypothetical protein